MATHRRSILNNSLQFDTSGDVWTDLVENIISGGTNSDIKSACIAMDYPTGSDVGFYGSFEVPQNYVGTPKIVAKMIVQASSTVVAMGVKCTPGIADNESADQAYETEDLAEQDLSSGGYADEDYLELSITLTPVVAYSAGDIIHYFYFADDDQDTRVTIVALTHLFFEYSDS